MVSINPARAAVLGVAVLAGAAAFMLVGGETPPPPAPAPAATAKPNTVDVLVAAVDLPLGNRVTQGDVRWIGWPQDSVPQGVIRRSDADIVDKEVIGTLVRAAIFASEPIRREKLMRADGSGFLSAILPSGKRAIAITIDSRGASSAGGFILPNDHVDVIRTVSSGTNSASGAEAFQAETILSNIRVLAIGQAVQEENGKKVVIGETATLEVDSRQAETIALAQKAGTLSLVLRSLADAQEEVPPDLNGQGGLSIVRFGVPSQTSRQ